MRKWEETTSVDIASSINSPVLSQRQSQLYQALCKKDPEAGDTFHAAITVLATVRSPAKYTLASHAIREIMKHLPKYSNVPQFQHTKQNPLRNKVDHLYSVWKKCNWICSDEQDYKLGDAERKYIRISREFFIDLEKERPRYTLSNVELMRHLEHSRTHLPPNIEIHRAKRWGSLYDYFAGVAHFKKPTDFNARLEEFETCLLNLLEPCTFQDFSEIDELLQEVSL